MELICSVQKYHWGSVGHLGLVARLAQMNANIKINESERYAEFWMGTHCNGPSKLKTCEKSLSEYLALHPVQLGPKVIEHFGTQLPFLFKVLSVKEPLSIQAHPTKQLARELSLKFPTIYKDDNHKPEIAIAVTNFEVLCGFRPKLEIKNFLKEIKEFSLLIDDNLYSKLELTSENEEKENDALLKACFHSFMSSKREIIINATEKLLDRLEKMDINNQEKYLFKLVKRINSFFPNDIGLFCIYWLNYVILSPGEALYLAPNEPHAYIEGDCIECMANSDNVVRAGLTPKYRDVDTLCSMLTYKNYTVSEILFSPVKEDEYTLLYAPPIKDFAVAKICVPKDCKYLLKKRESASILLVLEGSGKLDSTVLNFGKVLFLPANTSFSLLSSGIILYQAFCNC